MSASQYRDQQNNRDRRSRVEDHRQNLIQHRSRFLRADKARPSACEARHRCARLRFYGPAVLRGDAAALDLNSLFHEAKNAR